MPRTEAAWTLHLTFQREVTNWGWRFWGGILLWALRREHVDPDHPIAAHLQSRTLGGYMGTHQELPEGSPDHIPAPRMLHTPAALSSIGGHTGRYQ